jgi:squalene-hopene/tetraprenyl-beta-curcumene cyclase
MRLTPLVASLAVGLFATAPALAADAVGRAQALIGSGLGFLDDRQQADGTWQADERVPPAITALVLRAHVGSDGFDPDSPDVRRGYEALLAQQVGDGGIYDDLLANYNTAIAVSALAAARDEAGDDRYQRQIDDAIAYLRRLQWTPETEADFAGEDQSQQVSGEDDPFFGGWGYGGRSRGAGRPDLSNAGMALQALHDAGIPSDDPAYQKALVFISRLQNNSETNANDWAGDDGGFIYSPDADRSFESFGGEFVTPDGQRRLRSYGSMTYAGLKSMIYAGLTKDDPRVRAAFDWAQDNWTLDRNPGMPEGNEDHGRFYYYLMLARALDAYDQPVLDTLDGPVDWRVALIEKLDEIQAEDGSWAGVSKWREDDPVMVTAYAVNALNHAIKDLREHPPEMRE